MDTTVSIGKSFEGVESLFEWIDNLSRSKKVAFSIKNSEFKKLRYDAIRFECVHCGLFKSKGHAVRNTKSQKTGCKAFIQFRTAKKHLTITAFNTDHIGHDPETEKYVEDHIKATRIRRIKNNEKREKRAQEKLLAAENESESENIIEQDEELKSTNDANDPVAETQIEPTASNSHYDGESTSDAQKEESSASQCTLNWEENDLQHLELVEEIVFDEKGQGTRLIDGSFNFESLMTNTEDVPQDLQIAINTANILVTDFNGSADSGLMPKILETPNFSADMNSLPKKFDNLMCHQKDQTLNPAPQSSTVIDISSVSSRVYSVPSISPTKNVEHLNTTVSVALLPPTSEIIPEPPTPPVSEIIPEPPTPPASEIISEPPTLPALEIIPEPLTPPASPTSNEHHHSAIPNELQSLKSEKPLTALQVNDDNHQTLSSSGTPLLAASKMVSTDERASSTISSIPLNEIVLESTQSRGRPKRRARKTAMDRENVHLKVFAEKPLHLQLRMILGGILPDACIKNVLHGEYTIKKDVVDLLSPEDLNDPITSTSVELKEFSRYFDKDAFSVLKKIIAAKKESGEWYCGKCHEILQGDSVECESCLKWFHWNCESFGAALVGTWFCSICQTA